MSGVRKAVQDLATSPAGLLISRFQVRVLGGSLEKILDLQVKCGGATKPLILHRGLPSAITFYLQNEDFSE